MARSFCVLNQAGPAGGNACQESRFQLEGTLTAYGSEKSPGKITLGKRSEVGPHAMSTEGQDSL